jgi:hypothetical protein
MRAVCVLHTNMFELFLHGRDTLDRLLLPEIERWERVWCGATRTFQYYHKDTGYFVKLLGHEGANSVFIRSKLPLSAVEELSMDINERTMTVMQNDGSTREIGEELEIIRVYSTYITVYTAELTDTSTVDCILEAFVMAIKNGV